MATIRQEKALQNLVENGGNQGKAMIDAGYSESTAKTPSKVFKSKAVKNKLDPMLKRHDVTLDQYIGNIGKAMKAEKVVITGNGDGAFAEVVPDHIVRLAGNRQAREFLNIEDNQNSSSPELIEALKEDSDEMELQRIIFRKSKDLDNSDNKDLASS